MAGKFELDHISIKSFLTDGEYFAQFVQDESDFLDEVYEVGTEAFQTEMEGRSAEEIEHVMGGREAFPERLANPASDKGLLPNQLFGNPVLTVAFYKEDSLSKRIIGYSFGADAASGASEEIRRRKQQTAIKNYRYLKTVAVLPEFQHRGVGRVLSARQFDKANILQPASAYTRPGVAPAGTALVKSLGMKETKEDRRFVDMFGTGEKDVEQYRYARRSARLIVVRVLRDGGYNLNGLLQHESLRQVKRAERSS